MQRRNSRRAARTRLAAPLIALLTIAAPALADATPAGAMLPPDGGGPSAITLPILWDGNNMKFQETSWWCGPASTQLALYASGAGVISQSAIASTEGAQTHGTNDISDVVKALNGYLHDNYYVVKGDNGAVDVSTLVYGIDVNIRKNHAMVANGWSQITDVNGTSHPYSGGHYVAIVGYENFGNIAVIADPSGPTKGGVYKVTATELARWINYNNKGYTY